jgi:ketosteroid isomerase-like protein
VSVDADVLARADAWQALIEARDVDAIGAYLHPQYALMLVQPEALTVPRATWLRMLPDYVVHGYDILRREVDVDGDTAAVLQLVHQRATVAGQDRSGPFVISDVWRRGDGGEWQVWRRHSTPLDAGAMPVGMRG